MEKNRFLPAMKVPIRAIFRRYGGKRADNDPTTPRVGGVLLAFRSEDRNTPTIEGGGGIREIVYEGLFIKGWY